MTVERFRIGVTASFTPTPLYRSLLSTFVSGEDAEVVEADFNLVHQTLLDPEAESRSRRPMRSWCCGAWRTSSRSRSWTGWSTQPTRPG